MTDTLSTQPSRIGDVAARAGVSNATVSRVLSGKPHVSDAVRDRVMEAVRSLNYRPNRVAQSLRSQRTRFISLIVPDIENPFFSRIVRAVEDVMQQHDYAVFICNTDETALREQFYLGLCLDERAAGIIFAPTQADAGRYGALLSAKLPLVVIDRQLRGADVDTVVSNNQDASRLVVSHLLEQGHTRIGAVLSDLNIATGQERLEGYRTALEAWGVAFDAALTRFGKPVEAEGYHMTESLLQSSQPPTALFTGSKLLTLGALRYLYEQHIHVPRDIALAAFDVLDWLPNSPEMVMVEQPAYEMGRCAATMLLKRLARPERRYIHRTLSSTLRHTGAAGRSG